MADVLLTGFEPFGGENINPSWEIARAVEMDPPCGVTMSAARLPVDTEKVGACLEGLLEKEHPRVLIMLGQAGGRSVISIERVAINVLDFSIPDNSGRQVTDQPIISGGPAAFFSSLPVRAIMEALNAEAVPASISNSAGTYLCNQAMYLALHFIAANGLKTRAGFIHVPYLPEQACRQKSPAPSLSLATMTAGVRIAVSQASAGR